MDMPSSFYIIPQRYNATKDEYVEIVLDKDLSTAANWYDSIIVFLGVLLTLAVICFIVYIALGCVCPALFVI